jgi:hypothetical protein
LPEPPPQVSAADTRLRADARGSNGGIRKKLAAGVDKMPLHSIPETELRDHCRRAIEGLELWLRRLIDDRFSAVFGSDYMNAKKPNGDRLIRGSLAKELQERQAKQPDRFPRVIDAAFLEDQIDLICNPDHYRTLFAEALESAFGAGGDRLREMLSRMIAPRNALYHANPISVHDAYRVLCYSMDVVQSLKDYYSSVGKAQEYNVPTVIRVSDSLGHVRNLGQGNRPPHGSAMVDYSNDQSSYLRSGDTLSLEVEIDPSFDTSEYDIRWGIANATVIPPRITGKKFTLTLTEAYVSTRFCAVCWVTSKKGWHKLGSFDDQVDIAYRVLPPV